MLVKPVSWNRSQLDLFRQCFQTGRVPPPIIQRGLQCRRDVGRVRVTRQVPRNDNEASITTVLQGGKLHTCSMPLILLAIKQNQTTAWMRRGSVHSDCAVLQRHSTMREANSGRRVPAARFRECQFSIGIRRDARLARRPRLKLCQFGIRPVIIHKHSPRIFEGHTEIFITTPQVQSGNARVRHWCIRGCSFNGPGWRFCSRRRRSFR